MAFRMPYLYLSNHFTGYHHNIKFQYEEKTHSSSVISLLILGEKSNLKIKLNFMVLNNALANVSMVGRMHSFQS
jgi:hypothetical protein